VREQLAALAAAGADIRYVKPHGALYHAVRDDREQAAAVADAVADLSARLGRPVPLLGLQGDIAAAARAVGLPFRQEAFLDRGYLPDGALVPRVHAQRDGVDPHEGAVDGFGDAVACEPHGTGGHDRGIVQQRTRAVRAALDAAGVAVRAPW
jgi:UPF0271 protein